MRHRTADLEPLTIGGRYTLLRRLAVGGMAEIYLARQAAMAGFEKEVVIKRLRAELADDPKIVEMFLDEARIGALLNHPNIVHVYDVDEHDGIPYIAMEYIVGEELNELCRRGLQHGRFLPLEHAVELIRQASAGMGFYHAKRGPEGSATADQPLDIVHLDISPSNLLVTQDGFLKVIDFGIARARGQRIRTDVMPGKLSYMSPEQAARGGLRAPVDHRSDIFSLGIVLYEITVGRRLFRGAASEVVPKLVNAEVEPPTFFRRNFPPALESIVMRCLEKHPGDRYQSAYDLADDLESFLRDERLHSGPVRIARYLDILTHAGGGRRRPELVSEAEVRRGDDELDFDSQVFDVFRPAEGAPGPEQAREWEDAEQPEADVARALGLELAELRAMRTPVPVRAPGEPPAAPRPPAPVEDPPDLTARPSAPPARPSRPPTAPPPVPRAASPELEAPVAAAPAGPVAAPAGPVAAPPVEVPVPVAVAEASGPAAAPRPAALPAPAEPTAAPPAPRARPAPASGATAAAGAVPVPMPLIGSALLERSRPTSLPWVLVALLALAVAGLVAYIVVV